MENGISDYDLPLLANASEILVSHYVFDIFCDFQKKSFKGYVILQLEAAQLLKLDVSVVKQPCSQDFGNMLSEESNVKCEDTERQTNENAFVCILDCNQIIVNRIYELDMTVNEFEVSKFCASNLNRFKNELNFSVDMWSLKIWKHGVHSPNLFPNFICIEYETLHDGQSLLWVMDQDGNPAVYTYGAWINNRSLFPCQEPPSAMATWEAKISVDKPSAVVLMSGDNLPMITHSDSHTSYYYYTRMRLPMSTLALAVGFWNIKELNFSSKENKSSICIRICTTLTLAQRAVEEFVDYIFSCINSAEHYFGSYPFQRIDFLVIPRGFCSLGMASPNIIFLSQSMMSGDRSMCCRIAHEIAHSWFGLMIGASDWTEEWLSEGFATYAEDYIHTNAIEMTNSLKEDYLEIKAYARAKTLLAEVENTELDLHVLRPNKGEVVTEMIDGVEAVILKNGKNPEKCFMQVHYIKGFFLLKYLSELVGQDAFLSFLKKYIIQYKGQLVDSMDMLNLYIQEFSDVCGNQITKEEIISEWLHNHGIPNYILAIKPSSSNAIYNSGKHEAMKWKSLNKSCKPRKNAKRKKYDLSSFVEVTPDELLVVLDFLLEETSISSTVMNYLGRQYYIEHQNAEIRHKWCELVVKHRYYQGYDCLERFLSDDLAMGVYIYGEMILNGTAAQQKFAEGCFLKMKDEMEPNCIITIKQMLKSLVGT